MPRLLKYQTRYPQIAEYLQDVPDSYLEAIDAASIAYFLDVYYPRQDKLHAALQFLLVEFMYEYFLHNYYLPQNVGNPFKSGAAKNTKPTRTDQSANKQELRRLSGMMHPTRSHRRLA